MKIREKFIRKSFIILITIITIIACNDTIVDPPKPPIIAESTANYVVDSLNKIILINENVLVKESMYISIGKDSVKLKNSTNQINLSKKYDVFYGKGEYKLFRTTLPIISISTNGKEIPDDPKIEAEMTIYEPGKEIYATPIGIEKRGGASQGFPKKSYSLKTRANAGDKKSKDVSLLGMREDDSWILDGLWNEPLRIRDFTSHSIWLEMGRLNKPGEKTQIGIKREYCELFLNGKYFGVYYLGEKVDRKLLDLDKKNGELYKGEGFEKGTTFTGVEDYDNSSDLWSGYEFKHPKKIDWKYLYDFVKFVVNNPQEEFNNKISSKLDLNNTIDYLLLINLIYALDNHGNNLYTAKINKETPYFFVPWDMDASIGNQWDGERVEVRDIFIGNDLTNRLFYYPTFLQKLKARWKDLRKNICTNANIKLKFRKNYELLEKNGIYMREALVPELPHNYSKEEILYIESTIDKRISFLDKFLQ